MPDLTTSDCINGKPTALNREAIQIPLEVGRSYSLATRSQRFRRDRHESFPRTGLRTSIRFLIRALPADSVDGDSVWFVHLTQRRTSKPFTILFRRLTTTGGFPTFESNCYRAGGKR